MTYIPRHTTQNKHGGNGGVFWCTGQQLSLLFQFVQERLDFSCALFGPDGGLVSNAPHIPVHLGAMQETVQYQVRSVNSP